MRLYHAYLKFARSDFPTTARGGRFFLFQGVAVGVLDGVEVTHKLNSSITVSAFGGQQGPLSREWEVDRQGDSPWIGGQIRWRTGEVAGIHPTLAFSYTYQERDENILRQMAGVTLGLKISRKWSSLNVMQMNLSASTLRKALTRWRYRCPKLQFSLEAAYVQPYVNGYSYFSDFESEGGTTRFRNTIEYHFVPRKWGAGLSTMYFSTTESGFRTGPYVIFPFGRIGYHFASGNQPTNNVFYGYLNISPVNYLDLFAYAASMDYEWEAMNLGSYETTMMNGGMRIRPPFLKRTEFGLEWQNYTTPSLESYRRIIINLNWNFDYRVTP
jgi:hypothetical protein